MTLAEDLKSRGLIEQTSADLEQMLGAKRTVYLGVDPTSDSLQAGNLVVLLLMKRLMDAGHNVIFLVGGGTGMIGDPKEKGERPLSDARTIRANKRAINAQIQKILGRRVKLVDNADWLLKERLVDFLRDVGKHFTVNELVKREIIRRRLETPDESISYTEFAYSLLQGYDFFVLNQKYGADMQVGASDQWTNILSGVELIRRKLGKEAYALTCPLVTDASGKKFGKSEGNAVWLDPTKTTPYAFYQFWFNQPDALVGTYLKFYTFMPVPEIDLLLELHERTPGRREAQRMLARTVTQMVHGTEAAKRSEAVSEVLYGDRELGSLSPEEQRIVLADAPSAKATVGMSVVECLVATGLSASRSEARRLIEGKGVTLGDERVEDVEATLSPAHFSGRLALLRKGRQAALLALE